MTQAMRFSHNNHSVEFTEAYSDKTIRVNFWHPSNFSTGTIDIDEAHLIEMRNWINKQLMRMKQVKKKP